METLRHLIREAHRRSLWQVLLVYVVGAYVAFEAIGNLMDLFGLPDWVAPGALVLFIIGLPIVVATAFVQEGAPELPGRRDGPDDARQPGRLEGLQSAGDVMAHEAYAPAPAAAAASSSDGAATAVAAPAGAPFARASRTERLASHLTWGRAVLAGIAAFVLLIAVSGAYMVLRGAGVGPMGSLVGAGVLDERARVVLAEFESPASDPALGQVVTEALRIDLAQSPNLMVVDPGYIVDALRRMQRDPTERLEAGLARELAARDGLHAVIEGEVVPSGRRYLLTARISTPDGSRLAGFRETAESADDVIAAADALSRAIRKKVGESLASIRASEPLEKVSTSSLEALRLYSQAIRDMELGGENWQQAGARLEQAVALDPSFAMAWRKLGVFHQSWDNSAAADSAFTRAFELRDRLTTRERLIALGTYYQYVLNDYERAGAAYATVLETHADPVALSNLADIHRDEGRYDEAERLLRRAVETQARPFHYDQLITIVYESGRRDEARQLYAQAVERFGEKPFEWTPFHFAVAEQRYEEADSILTAISERAGDAMGHAMALSAQANLLAVRGRFREAEDNLQPLFDRIERQGASLGLIRSLFPVQMATFLYRDTIGAAERVQRAIAAHPLEELPVRERPYLMLVSLWSELGHPAEARTYLERAEREQARFLEPEDVHYGRAFVARARGDDEDALRELRAAYEVRTCRAVCYLFDLAETHARMGQADSAMVYYRRFLEAPELHRAGIDPYTRQQSLFRLAELYEERGRDEEAARHYAEFVDLMEDSDPIFAESLAEARRRLAVLARE